MEKSKFLEQRGVYTVCVFLFIDVMDVAWSPHDVWLASCSVDNTIVIWNARKFPSRRIPRANPVCSLKAGNSFFIFRILKRKHVPQSRKTFPLFLSVFCVAPEMVTCLRGHTGLVKGLTWDPVGKYIASQADDHSLRVWRTMDWQMEANITKPFSEVQKLVSCV